MPKDIEQFIEEDVKGKSSNYQLTILFVITFLSTVWLVVQFYWYILIRWKKQYKDFEGSDIEIVQNNFNNIDEELKYLREKVDGLKTPKVKSYDGDIIKLQNEIDKLKVKSQDQRIIGPLVISAE